jgi:hypothetical protein
LHAWQCKDAGIPGPFSFTVEMYEEDSGFWHDCFTGEWGCDFSSVAGYPGSNDELIGKRTLEFTAEKLAAAMPNINDTFEETIDLGPCFDERGCPMDFPGKPIGPEYTFTYVITRLPDVSVGPVVGPVN